MLGYNKEFIVIVMVMVKNISFDFFFKQLYLILALLNWAAQIITNTVKKKCA